MNVPYKCMYVLCKYMYVLCKYMYLLYKYMFVPYKYMYVLYKYMYVPAGLRHRAEGGLICFSSLSVWLRAATWAGLRSDGRASPGRSVEREGKRRSDGSERVVDGG